MNNNTITRLYTTEKGYFDFDTSVPCIIAGKFGFLTSDEFRAYMKQGLQLIIEKKKEHQYLGWIANINQANVYDPEDSAWMIDHWNHEAIKAGLRYIAFITPESDFVKVGIDKYIRLSEGHEGFIIKKFDNMKMAKTWLRAQFYEIGNQKL